MKRITHIWIILIFSSSFFPAFGQNLGTEVNHEEIKIDISDNQQPYPFNFKDWWSIVKDIEGNLVISRTEFSSDMVILRKDLRIDKASGDISIGTLDSDTDLHIYQEGNSSSTSGIRLDDGTAEWNIYIKGNSENDLAFSHNGTIKAEIEWITGNYVVGSDINLKTNIEPLANVLDRVMRLKPVQYHYKGYKSSPQGIGFIAQEVESVYPELVHFIGENKALVYDNFAILAIKAIQEQQKKIEVLERKVKALEAEK